ncbi:aldolase [Actinopolymorpha pittospori]
MPDPGLGRLARDDGTFVMVAMDQRESLRSMLAQTSERTLDDVADEELSSFKQEVAATLGPHGSGFLLDPAFGGSILAAEGGGSAVLGERTGLIVAADLLTARPGEVVGEARFDETLDLSGYAARGVAAAKLLVVWREDDQADERIAHAERFVAACRAAGLPSIVEGVVRPTGRQREEDTFDREATLLRCARALGGLGPSLYKAEVPYFGRDDAGRITKAAREVTDAVPCPWVVLSSNVTRADFPAAVAACCRGGASGLLAGRALWTNALPAADRARALREESVPYLRELAAIVSADARPFPAVGA